MAVLAPPPAILTPLRPQILDFLRRVRSVRGYGVSSWWRSVRHNSAVGGQPLSQHLLGLAVDVEAVGSSSALIAAFARAGLVAIDEGDHVHVQARAAGATPRSWYRLAV